MFSFLAKAKKVSKPVKNKQQQIKSAAIRHPKICF